MSNGVRNLRDKINEIKRNLQLSDEDFQLVRLTKYQQILHSILNKFTSLKVNQINKWWWDSFPDPIYYFHPENVFNSLSLLIDHKESVWLVIDDESKKLEHYWLYEGGIYAIISVLKELPFQEYYIVSKKLEWIICENHHNYLIGCGEPIINKMKKLSLTKDVVIDE